MKEHIKTASFLLFASSLWFLTIFGINELAQRYPRAVDALPLVTVRYDSILGRYLLLGDYEIVYPTLLLIVLTVLFLWKSKVPLQEFGALAIFVPWITLIAAVVISSLSGRSGHRDDGVVLLFAFYILPVVSFLLGAGAYVLCQKLIGKQFAA